MTTNEIITHLKSGDMTPAQESINKSLSFWKIEDTVDLSSRIDDIEAGIDSTVKIKLHPKRPDSILFYTMANGREESLAYYTANVKHVTNVERTFVPI